MLIIGLDVALANTGLAALKDDQVLGWCVIETAEDVTLSAAAALNKRVRELRTQLRSRLADWGCAYAQGERVLVAIEYTDWSPGRTGTRDQWIREAGARWALGLAVATALLAAEDLGYETELIGVTDWMDAFGSRGKDDIAELVAYEFPATFRSEWRPRRQRGGSRSVKVLSLTSTLPARRIVEVSTGRPVPSHVTDALALARVAQKRRRLADLIASQSPAEIHSTASKRSAD